MQWYIYSAELDIAYFIQCFFGIFLAFSALTNMYIFK